MFQYFGMIWYNLSFGFKEHIFSERERERERQLNLQGCNLIKDPKNISCIML